MICQPFISLTFNGPKMLQKKAAAKKIVLSLPKPLLRQNATLLWE